MLQRIVAIGVCASVVGCIGRLGDNPDDEVQSLLPEQTLCAHSPVADGVAEVTDPISGTLIGDGSTDDTGKFCVTVKPAFGSYDICVGDGSHISQSGTRTPMQDGQRYCTSWFVDKDETPSAPMHIDWVSHATYVLYRRLLVDDTVPSEVWAIAKNLTDGWGACATGGSIVDASPIYPMQSFVEPPALCAGLVRGLLVTAMDWWPLLLNDRLYDGAPVLTPSMMIKYVGDDLADGISDGLDVGGKQIILPGSDYALGHDTLRSAIGGLAETLVVVLRSDLHHSGITDESTLVQCLCTATDGIFTTPGQPCDLLGPLVRVTNLAARSVVSDDFALVVDFVDDVAVVDAHVVTGEDYCHSVIAQDDDCEGDDYRCTLEATVDITSCDCDPGEVRLPIVSTDAHRNTATMDFFVVKNEGGPTLSTDIKVETPLDGIVEFRVVADDPQGVDELTATSDHPGLSCDLEQITTTDEGTILPCTLASTDAVDGSYELILSSTDSKDVETTDTRSFVTNNYDPGTITAVAHMETRCSLGTCSAYTWQDATRGKLLASAPLGDGGRCELVLPDTYSGHVQLVAADCSSYSPALSRQLTAASGAVLSTVAWYHPPLRGEALDEPTLALNSVTSYAALKTRALHRSGKALDVARSAAYGDWGAHLRGFPVPIDIAHTIGVDLSDPDAVAAAGNEQIIVALFDYGVTRRAGTWARSLERPIDAATWAGTAFVAAVVEPEYATDSLLDGLSDRRSIALTEDRSVVVTANTLRIGVALPAYLGLLGEPLPDGRAVSDDIGLVADDWYGLFEYWAGVTIDDHFGGRKPEAFDQRDPLLDELNMSAGQTATNADFDVSGRCFDEGVGLQSVFVEVLDAQGEVVQGVVGDDQLHMSIEHFKHTINVAEDSGLDTGEYVVRITCTDAMEHSLVVERDLVVDVDKPEGAINFDLAGHETRTNAQGVIEVDGDGDTTTVIVEGTFFDVGTGVKRIEFGVDGTAATVAYDVDAGTFRGDVTIACNQWEPVVVGMQIFDYAENASDRRELKIRCDRHAPTASILATVFFNGRTITVTCDDNSCTYDASNAESVTVGPEGWPLHFVKFFNRADHLPLQGRGVAAQNLPQLLFVASDMESGPGGVFVLPGEIQVSYRFSMGGIVKRDWEDIEAGDDNVYRLPFAYQTLHADIGLVDKDTELLVEIKLSDGLKERVNEFPFFFEMIQPPGFLRNCRITIGERGLDDGTLEDGYTRDDKVPFAECDLVYILDLPEGSLAPAPNLEVEIYDGGETAALWSDAAFGEKEFDGDYEDFCGSRCACPDPSGEYAHRLGARGEPEGAQCIIGEHQVDSSCAWLAASHRVFGSLRNGENEFPQDAVTKYWSLPTGAHSLVMISSRPRTRVLRWHPNFPRVIIEAEYGWGQYWSSEIGDSAYVIVEYEGYDMHRTGTSVRARDWNSMVFLGAVGLSVQIPEMRVTHPTYGEIEIIKDSNATHVTTTLSE